MVYSEIRKCVYLPSPLITYSDQESGPKGHRSGRAGSAPLERKCGPLLPGSPQLMASGKAADLLWGWTLGVCPVSTWATQG